MTLSVPDFGNCRVLVAGDLMLDRYWLGPAHRISPEAPVPVVNIQQSEDRAGGAANVAVNLAALGVQTDLCGITGDDSEAEVLSALLRQMNVNDRISRSSKVRTITKLRVLSRNQQLIRLDSEEDIDNIAAVGIEKPFRQAVADCEVVILSDYAKGTLNEVAQLISVARSANKIVLIDPKGTDFEKYRGASIITPNLQEFEAIAGPSADERDLTTKARELCTEFDIDAMLVTRSSEGMSLITKEDEHHFEAQAREVYDVTGAGDTVIATLGAALAVGLTLPDSVALANLAASIVVGKLGVATVTRSELRQTLHGRGTGGRGLLAADQLVEYVEEAKARGERIVFTNGCFDILHAGHVAYLEEAKALGARLIVAVNDDESVSRLKGPSRPVNGLADRLAVLSGLAAVDWVIPFSDDTPLALIEAVSPDILVKGGDYKADDIVGADWVRKHGGEVTVLTFRQGRSTTELINTIRNL